MKVNFDEYKFEKIDAISQFHIVRRIAPIIGEALAVLSGSFIKDGADKSIENVDFDKIAKDIGPILTALSKLPDADVEYVLFALLKVVQRKNAGGGWSRITTDTNHFMFDDIKGNMAVMIQLSAKSFQANLSGFLNALPSGLKEGALQSQQIG